MELKWTKCMDVLSDYCNGVTMLKINWSSGLSIIGMVDTLSETDNCLDDDDPNYCEYYMAVVKIIKILQYPDTEPFRKRPGELMEVSEFNEPSRIELEDGTIVFENGDVPELE